MMHMKIQLKQGLFGMDGEIQNLYYMYVCNYLNKSPLLSRAHM